MAVQPYSERRSAVLKNNTTKILWYVILILTIISAAYSIYGLVTFSSTQEKVKEALQNTNLNQNTNIPISIEALAKGATNFALGVLIFGLLLEVIIFWGVYQLGGWVRWILWIGFALTILTLNIVSIVLTLFWALAYQYVYKRSIAPVTPSSQSPAA